MEESYLLPTFDYLNHHLADPGTDLLDFNREQDGPFFKGTNVLPLTNLTNDVYAITGQRGSSSTKLGKALTELNKIGKSITPRYSPNFRHVPKKSTSPQAKPSTKPDSKLGPQKFSSAPQRAQPAKPSQPSKPKPSKVTPHKSTNRWHKFRSESKGKYKGKYKGRGKWMKAASEDYQKLLKNN